MKVTTASAQYRADFYKNGFSYKHFIQNLWRHLLTMTSYKGTAVTFHTLSMAEPSANNRLNTTRIRLDVRQQVSFWSFA